MQPAKRRNKVFCFVLETHHTHKKTKKTHNTKNSHSVKLDDVLQAFSMHQTHRIFSLTFLSLPFIVSYGNTATYVDGSRSIPVIL